jgi:NAD(P)-dependent dehydrogenase (short-subunit alcohol dehydrogenase family)
MKLIYKPENKHYHVYTIIWILIIYSNYYFHGCILARIEQNIFQDKTWCGPINLILHLFSWINKTNKSLNNLVKYYVTAPISIILIFKYFFCKNITDTIIGSILAIILTPLLFIHPQSNILNFFAKTPNHAKIMYNPTDENTNYERFNNKTIAITGCSSGIGKNIVHNIINNSNATVILLNRQSLHLQTMLDTIKNKNVININCDLTDFNSVYDAYSTMISKFPEGIDILINNAGIWNSNDKTTTDGYNAAIQTNFYSHALLMELLLQFRKRKNITTPFEIINMSSMSYNIPDKKLDESFFQNRNEPDNNLIHVMFPYYYTQIHYQQSKLAMILYSQHLCREILKKDENVKVACVHPGICKTNLFENTNIPFFKYILHLFYTSEFASKFIINCILNNNIQTGNFYGLHLFTNSFENISNPISINSECSQKLYILTKQIIQPFLQKDKAGDDAC